MLLWRWRNTHRWKVFNFQLYDSLYIYDVLLFEFSPQLACETFIKNMNYVEKLPTYNSCLSGFCIHVVFALSQPQGKNAIRFKDLRKGWVPQGTKDPEVGNRRYKIYFASQFLQLEFYIQSEEHLHVTEPICSKAVGTTYFQWDKIAYLNFEFPYWVQTIQLFIQQHPT